MLYALYDFPKPNDLTSAWSWFGLINQVAWAYSFSTVMQPFRDLIRPNQKFYWDDSLGKLLVIKAGCHRSRQRRRPVIRPTRQTCIQADWSVDGVSYSVLQKYCDCSTKLPVCCNEGWKLIIAASRFIKSSERNYSLSECEALTLSYSLHHLCLFPLGYPDLLVATKHKPLLETFNKSYLAVLAILGFNLSKKAL